MGAFGASDGSSNLPRATTYMPQSTEFDSLLTKYLFYLRNNGYRPTTIKGNVKILKTISKYADLLNPESVKACIAQKEWSGARKRNAAYAYRHLVNMEGLSWDMPKYYGESKLPYIPLENEVDSLIASMPPILATLTRTLKETGARISEAVQIHWKDVDTERNVITINNAGKNGLPRSLKVSKGLIAIMLRYGSQPRIFRGKPSTYRRRFEIYRRRVAEKNQNPRLEYISFHTFRHFFATMLYYKTKDILYVKQKLGHKNIQNTLIYTHLVDFKEEDNFTVKVAASIDEFTALLEAGFEFVTDFEGNKICRKRK